MRRLVVVLAPPALYAGEPGGDQILDVSLWKKSGHWDNYQENMFFTESEKRTYEVAEVSGKLKDIAVQTGVALLSLAQLNRENEKDKGRQPRLTDLADSGQIERDADLVMLLDRDRKEAKGEASIVIAKQRDGECGLVKLWYDGQFCRFSEPPID